MMFYPDVLPRSITKDRLMASKSRRNYYFPTMFIILILLESKSLIVLIIYSLKRIKKFLDNFPLHAKVETVAFLLMCCVLNLVFVWIENIILCQSNVYMPAAAAIYPARSTSSTSLKFRERPRTGKILVEKWFLFQCQEKISR